MRNSILIKGAFIGLALAFLLSCAPKKRLVPSGGGEKRVSRAERTNVFAQVAQQQRHYTTFSGRAKSVLTINEKERYDVTANVRIVHNEAIWISVTALMGIEVARVLITPDSVKIINRLRAEYIRKPLDYLHHFTSSELDFPSLQQLLVGDVIDDTADGGMEVWQSDEGYLLQKQTNDLQYMVRLDTDYHNIYTSMDEAKRGQRLEAFYSDYKTTGGNTFPHHMEISIAAPQLILQSEMKYSRVVYDEMVEMPFNVPSRYSEVQ